MFPWQLIETEVSPCKIRFLETSRSRYIHHSLLPTPHFWRTYLLSSPKSIWSIPLVTKPRVGNWLRQGHSNSSRNFGNWKIGAKLNDMLGSRAIFYSSSVVSDSVTPCTVACQALLATAFSRQEYWSGLPFPSLGDPPDPGIKPESLASAGGFLTAEPPGKSPRAIRSYRTSNRIDFMAKIKT